MHKMNQGKAANKSLRERIAIIIREPLFHFLIIGVVLYFLYGLFVNKASIEPDNTITVTAAQIEWLEQTWQKRWNRPPTPKEKQGLIDAYVKESIMYQQALAIGLDADDTIIRRRLAQKLEFLTRDLTEIASPSKEELRTYFDMHQDQYRIPASLSFTHVYFSTDKRQAQTVNDAKETLTKLQAESELTQSFKDMGDPFMLQQYYPDKTQQEILRLFGNEFSSKTFQIPVGQWAGPVESAYGLHLVYVHGRVESTMPDMDDLQERILQDWAGDKRREINEKFYASLLSRYEVIVEQKESNEKTLVSGKLQ
jgi:hypothetical protein